MYVIKGKKEYVCGRKAKQGAEEDGLRNNSPLK